MLETKEYEQRQIMLRKMSLFTDNIITLRLFKSDGISYIYDIFLNNRHCRIGSAEFRLSNFSEYEVLGNLGYKIDKAFQNNGYGTRTLALLLKIAKQNNLKEVRITTLENNEISKHLIEKNNAINLGTIEVPKRSRYYNSLKRVLAYKINLEKEGE